MMRTPESPRHSGSAAGFTLPAVLVVTGALLILAVGILLVASIERSTARSFVDRQRAELAAQAGLEEIRGILTQEAANDDYVVLQSTLDTPITTGREPAPQLFLARGKGSSSSYSYRYIPLFSAASKPTENSQFAPPKVEPLVGKSDTEWIDFTALPFNDKVRASWLPVADEKGRTVGRYAYWVEDLQGRIDPKIAGNEIGESGKHARAKWPFPAAGLNDLKSTDSEAPLDQIALYAIDPAATEEEQKSLGKSLIKNRDLLISPDSSLAGAGILPPLARDTTGHLVDAKARAAEEALYPGVRPYLERALVPFTEGIDPSVAGQPKINLNKLLGRDKESAISEMADFIKKGLPKFDDALKGRPGGFPENYIKTLAANAIDYADKDNEPSVAVGSYRGLDGYPFVSEFLMTFKWTGVPSVGGRKIIEIKVSTFVEVWNMTNKEVSGDVQVSFETGYNFPLGANPSVDFSDMSTATPKLEQSEGYYWFPKQPISLKPNQYKVIRCGEILYKLDAGPASVFVPSPISLSGETYGTSKAGYRMRWNGKMVDQAGGGVHRNDINLKFPTIPTTRATIPGHSYKKGPSPDDWMDNMGDPRMSAYLKGPQDANSYPQNYSPNRRNIRWGSIYSSDAATKPKLYGRVMPSEWPDGGHNSSCESLPIAGVSETSDPDHPNFMKFSSNSVLLNPLPEEAPMRLSNEGRFFSATELGRVYDPIMWQVANPSGANLPYGDVQVTTAKTTQYGGGNTLRIGRPEHPRFDIPSEPGLEAYHLLDLFHAGIPLSEDSSEREGDLVRIDGHVNVNTAGRDALRALAIGAATMDPKISKRTSDNHNIGGLMAPPVADLKLSPADIVLEANRVADAIIRYRKTNPFASPASIAEARGSLTDAVANGKIVFGNKELFPDGAKIQRTDSAAEEVFARVYEAATVRSRNFRIWVVGQSLAPTTSTSAKPEVLAEVRRAYTVFANPGERKSDGSIDPAKSKLEIIHETDF